MLPRVGHRLDTQQRVRLASELEEAFGGGPHVDLVVLPEASPYLALDIVQGERLCVLDTDQEAEYELCCAAPATSNRSNASDEDWPWSRSAPRPAQGIVNAWNDAHDRNASEREGRRGARRVDPQDALRDPTGPARQLTRI